MRFPELRFLDRFDSLVPLLMIPGIYALGELAAAFAPGLGTNGPQLLVWGFCISTVALYHCTFTINSLAHRFGSRRYETSDSSRNNFLLSLLTFGEGWHNNHHHYPGSVRQGFRWWEIDVSYYVLQRPWPLLGLVWDLRPVPARVLAAGENAVKVAVVGTGISGLVAARELHARARPRRLRGRRVDRRAHEHRRRRRPRTGRSRSTPGFIVFNEKTYPNFCALMRQLGVAWQPSDMSFSVRCERTGLEYNGTSTRTGSSRSARTSCARPSGAWSATSCASTARLRPSSSRATTTRPSASSSSAAATRATFVEQHMIPMGAAIWSARPDSMRAFPLRFLVQFFHNHGFLQVDGRPQWLVIRGGSREYVEPADRPVPLTGSG